MTDEPVDPRIRLVDRCKWDPWAFIDNNGLPRKQMNTDLFSGVVLPARAVIERAMQRNGPGWIQSYGRFER